MNLFLHGVEPHIYLGDTIYEPFRGERYDVILTNPPFGTKGANQAPEREDFTIETSNKQLNFVQHVLTALKPGGRAAIVLPDNCLFEGKAGEVFEILMQDCNLHTVLRLPRGTFTPYSQGVKANVIFFQKGPPTEQIWIFDARSNVPGITKKDRPLTPQHFAEFEKAYGTDPNGTEQTHRSRTLSYASTSTKSRNANTSSTSPGSRTNRSKTATNCPNRRTSPRSHHRIRSRRGRPREIVALVEKEEGVEK